MHVYKNNIVRSHGKQQQESMGYCIKGNIRKVHYLDHRSII